MSWEVIRSLPELVVAARNGLPGLVDDHRWTTVTPPGTLLAGARIDGLFGFLSEAISSGSVTVDDATAATVREGWQRAMVGSVAVEALIVRTAEILDDRDVRWRLTKGAALAHLDFGDQLNARTFGDMDLVIHPDDWYRALDVTAAAGYGRQVPEMKRGFDHAYGKGATLLDPDGLEVDLHLRFAIGRFGVRARPAVLFDRQDSITLAGRTIPTLAGSDRLLHACHHLVLGGFSALRAARDVAQLVLVSQVDWGETVRTAERWKVDAVVARGVMLAWERLGLSNAHSALDWARERRIGRCDLAAIRAFESQRSYRVQALTALTSLPPAQIPAYLMTHAFRR